MSNYIENKLKTKKREEVEYVICCAMIVQEEKLQYPCVENKNLKIGFSHADIIKGNAISNRKVREHEGQKGFLTSKLEFYFREESATIAYHAGQIPSKRGLLFSDDFDIKSYYDKFIKENPDKAELLKQLME